MKVYHGDLRMLIHYSIGGSALWLLLCAFTICASSQEMPTPSRSIPNDQGASRQGRVAPLTQVSCPRNNLTVYSGRVIGYERKDGKTLIRIRTDWDTVENVVLQSARRNELIRMFLLRGETFDADDWVKIETAKGRLLPNVRVNAWVCDNGAPPLLDWRPGETDRGAAAK